jgi:streptogramin lyase
VRAVTRAFAIVATVALLAGFGSANAAPPPEPTISVFPVPNSSDGSLFYPTLGPDGNVWAPNVNNPITRILTHPPYTVTQFALPGEYSYLTSMVIGPDGNLWFADEGQYSFGKIGRSESAMLCLVSPYDSHAGVATIPPQNCDQEPHAALPSSVGLPSRPSS